MSSKIRFGLGVAALLVGFTLSASSARAAGVELQPLLAAQQAQWLQQQVLVQQQLGQAQMLGGLSLGGLGQPGLGLGQGLGAMPLGGVGAQPGLGLGQGLGAMPLGTLGR